MSEITITLPVPPEQLTGNGRYHRMGKARLTKECREQAKADAQWTLMAKRLKSPMWVRAKVRAVWYLGYRCRQLDQQNAIHGLKAYIDGLQDAGILKDDRGVVWEPVEWQRDRRRPRVEITVMSTDTPTLAAGERKA